MRNSKYNYVLSTIGEKDWPKRKKSIGLYIYFFFKRVQGKHRNITFSTLSGQKSLSIGVIKMQ